MFHVNQVTPETTLTSLCIVIGMVECCEILQHIKSTSYKVR